MLVGLAGTAAGVPAASAIVDAQKYAVASNERNFLLMANPLYVGCRGSLALKSENLKHQKHPARQISFDKRD